MSRDASLPGERFTGGLLIAVAGYAALVGFARSSWGTVFFLDDQVSVWQELAPVAIAAALTYVGLVVAGPMATGIAWLFVAVAHLASGLASVDWMLASLFSVTAGAATGLALCLVSGTWRSVARGR